MLGVLCVDSLNPMTSSPSFLDRLASGQVLISDGATGTNLQSRGLARGTAPETWVLEQPQQILQLHRDFLTAGADILLTCTFGGTELRLAHAGLAVQAEQINAQAVALAKQAAGDAALVAGSIGPTGQMLQPFGNLAEEDALAAFTRQARWLVEAGVDLLVIETQFDLAEARLALQAARAVCDLPVVCSFSYDRGTRTMMGVKPAQMAAELGEMADVLGINCGRSLEQNLQALRELRAVTDKPIWFKPNAGLPATDEHGGTVYSVSPEQMGACVPDWLSAGARIVGGCCGTSPAHLQRIAEKVKGS